ncbi:hypothetical protein QYE76_070945 [Lolium multiflorum]|uniref:Cell wall hydroxyproline-rich glycoprotein n=1 Tax=Lolium multiflorum TaxID=4521 RepID=A0AAD8SIU6_LOLMU|nr:hypothetical protein QYE76_070945 [Lolium multiflorum]
MAPRTAAHSMSPTWHACLKWWSGARRRGLRAAYITLQTWRRTAIFSDPTNFTANWAGPNVCAYNGVYCAPHPADGAVLVVVGLDLNHADIAGFLPANLPAGLPDLALLHLNSNRFCGVLPGTFLHLRLLHELDISNNRFVGAFPAVVLALPSLKYLDLRFNDFEGPIPPALFDRPLDAIFLNSNRLTRISSNTLRACVRGGRRRPRRGNRRARAPPGEARGGQGGDAREAR